MKNYGRQILRKWNIFRVFFFLLSFCLCAGNLTLTSQAANSASASTVRLSKTEGTVEVSDSAGKAAFYRQDMRLANGDHTVTAERSYAWFSLDDTKVVKEDAVSDVEVRKRGQKLEVLVNSGSLFFNITEPLKEDESLNIRTSTMVMGVRGTCGVIKGVGEGITCLQLLTGHLECIVTNPETGDTKIISLEAGDEAYFYADQTGQRGVTNIVIEKLAVEDLNGFVLMELVGDLDLLNKIREESGLDFSAYTIDDARARLLQDQADTAAKNNKPLTVNNRKINNGIKDPVWEKDKDPQPDTSGDDSSSSDSSGNPDEDQKIGPVVRLTMKVTATEVQEYLNNPDVEQVILEPSSSGDSSDNVLEVDIDLNVPEGKTLTTQRGVYVDVQDGKSATVDGTANLSGNLTNKGEIKVNSSNSLHVSKDILNHGSVVVTSSGLTTVGGKFIGYEGSALSNEGQFEGIISGEGMIFQNRGTAQGDVMGSFEKIELMGGTLTGSVDAVITTLFDLEGGTVNGTVSLSGGEIASIKLISGAITATSENAALVIEASNLGNVFLAGATVTNNGSGSAMKYGGSGELSYSGGTSFRAKEFEEVVEPRIPFWHGGESGDYYALLAGGYSYTVRIGNTHGEAFGSHSITLQGSTERTAQVTEGEMVTIQLSTGTHDSMHWEAFGEDGRPFIADKALPADDGRYSYGTVNLVDAPDEISFKMPSHDVTVDLIPPVIYEQIFHLEEDTSNLDVQEWLSYPSSVLIRPGATSDSFSMSNDDGEFVLSTDTVVTIDEEVTITVDADSELQIYGQLYNSGTVSIYGQLVMDRTGSIRNDNVMTIQTGATMTAGPDNRSYNNKTFTNRGTIEYLGSFQNLYLTDDTGSTGAVFDNYGTLTVNNFFNYGPEDPGDVDVRAVFNNRGGATVTVETGGTFENKGTFNNYESAGAVINGSIDNISPHTFNNYGTVILSETGVLNNGDGAGNDGVFNNFADNGVIRNSGTIINNDGSTFRNYGSIIEDTPDAVSPELAPGSRPVVRYGEDPDAVLSGIPEGASGGPCGDTLFWYFEELEEEEAEALRHFTEGHTASASDAERAEDDASVSYILHITGSGAMDNFDLDGGNSTAPWFEELDGVVRAVKIDAGVTQIGKNAFYGIRTLAYVSFAGTDTEWKSVKVQSGNEALDKTVLLFGGDDDLVLGDPLLAEDEEVSWTEPEAKPAAAAADKPAAGKATASDAEKEEQEGEKKEEGDTEQKPETPETPWAAEPESRKPEETESGKSGNGKQDSEA